MRGEKVKMQEKGEKVGVKTVVAHSSIVRNSIGIIKGYAREVHGVEVEVWVVIKGIESEID